MEDGNNKAELKLLDWAIGILNCKPQTQLARSSEGNTVYKLSHQDTDWYLKIGSKLEGERDRILWLQNKLPVPEIIGFTEGHQHQALLMSAISGIDLAHLCETWSAEKIIQKLVKVLQDFHSIDIADCPFGKIEPNKVLVHGDACLPNFVFHGDEFSGYIDLGDMSVSDVETDLSASLWSLNHNLGSGHGLRFLQEFGIENASEEMAEELRQKY